MLFHLAKHQIAPLVLMLAAATEGGLTACTAVNKAESTPAGASHGSMNLGVADADYDLRFIDGVTI
jgi:uncharacterized protein (DUF305 family)